MAFKGALAFIVVVEVAVVVGAGEAETEEPHRGLVLVLALTLAGEAVGMEEVLLNPCTRHGAIKTHRRDVNFLIALIFLLLHQSYAVLH